MEKKATGSHNKKRFHYNQLESNGGEKGDWESQQKKSHFNQQKYIGGEKGFLWSQQKKVSL